MTLEAAVVIGKHLEILYRHTPANRSAGYLPEGRLWDELVKHHQSGALFAVAHSHPGHGPPHPSETDWNTFRTVESVYGLGVDLDWWIMSLGDRKYTRIRRACHACYSTSHTIEWFYDFAGAQARAMSQAGLADNRSLSFIGVEYASRHWGSVLEDLSRTEDLPSLLKDMVNGFAARGEPVEEERDLVEVIWRSQRLHGQAMAAGAPTGQYAVMARVAMRHPGLGRAIAVHAMREGQNGFARYLAYGLNLGQGDLPGGPW